MRTVAPPKVVGSGTVAANASLAARFAPNNDAMLPTAGARPLKLAPLTRLVSMNAGTAPVLLTVNGRAADAPPPGVGVKTLTCAAPPTAISLAGMAAMRSVELTNEVGRGAPFQR